MREISWKQCEGVTGGDVELAVTKSKDTIGAKLTLDDPRKDIPNIVGGLGKAIGEVIKFPVTIVKTVADL